MRFVYDAAGDKTQITWPDGFCISYLYDPLGRMSSIHEYGVTSGPGQLATYGYDNLGRLASAAYAGAGSGATIGQSFQYDSVSRLGTVGDSFADASKNTYLSLSYNAADQVKTKGFSNGLYEYAPKVNAYNIYQPNALDQIASITNQGAGVAKSFSYDAKGNLTSDGTNSYSYTTANQLTGGPNIGLGYDAVGHLISNYNYSQSAQTQYLYDGDELIAEYNGSGVVTARYVHGPGVDSPVVWYNSSWTSDRRWLVANEQGSIIAVANASGQLLAANTYDEYGLPGASNLGRFQYAGQAWIPELGMYDDKARFYSPPLGRFLQTDPSGYTDGLNWYAYAHNDAVNGTDPSGLDSGVDGDDCCSGGSSGGGGGYNNTFLGGDGNPPGDGSADPAPTPSPADPPSNVPPSTTTDEIVVTAPRPMPQSTPSVSEVIVIAQRNSPAKPPIPDAEGPYSVVEHPGANGSYTTYDQLGPLKQYRGQPARPHGGIPRPNVKVYPRNTAPNGRVYPGTPEVRPPVPEEIPPVILEIPPFEMIL